jgi:hypothetical protein
VAGAATANATETLQLKTVVSIPNAGKITSFDISAVDTFLGLYALGDRTNKGITVVDTTSNQVVMTAGAGLFKGVVLVNGVANNNLSGPDGVMFVGHREIWAGDGDSTLKFLSAGNGILMGQVNTGGQFRVDEMCLDTVHNIGFVANNADTPPFITAVSVRSHAIIGQIFFDGTNGTPLATNGIEQCVFNPRDNMIYVTVPEISGPGDNTAAGGISRIDPVSLHVTATAVIPHNQCAGPQGLAVGPVLAGTFGEMLAGCNGAVVNESSFRPTVLVDDGSQPGGFFGNTIVLPFQSGNDMVAFNPADNHYYLARSANNSFGNPSPDPLTGFPYGCPTQTGAIFYGGSINISSPFPGTRAESYPFNPAGSFAGPQVLGMVNALTGQYGADTITALFPCTPTNPGPKGIGKSGASNPHGNAHSVGVDDAHGQIYVPIPSNAVATGQTGLCAQGGGVDTNGCIAVFQTVGSDP